MAKMPVYSLPVDIKLTRVGKRTMDYDNLVTSLKSARDAVADLLVPGLKPGRADNNPGLKFFYFQENGKEYGLKIEICPH
jgi:hypothetical protein